MPPPPPDAPSPEPVARARNPWWIPPFLGRVPAEIDPPLLRLMGFVALGLVFENYDLALVNATISRVAADLDIAVGDVGWYTAVVRLGGLLTFALVPFADRIGRRRVFLVSFVGMTLGTVATALSQTPVQYVAAQFATRAFMLTAAAVGIVIVSEEMPAAHRGWAMGTLVAVAALGYGLATILFSFVDALPFGWRSLYALGVVPILLLPVFRRELRETRRFEAHRAARGEQEEAGWGGQLRPVVQLARTHPLRAAAIGGAGFFFAAGTIAVFQYMIFLVEEIHGWPAWGYSVLVIGGGLLGIMGNVIAGRLADRVGRRTVGVTAFLLYPIGAIALYNGPAWVLPAAWVLVVLFGTAGDVIVRVLGTELFPTSHRSTAVGWLMLLQTAGWSIGLLAVGALDVGIEDLGRVVGGFTLVVALAGLSLLLLPETRSLELETISGEGASG